MSRASETLALNKYVSEMAQDCMMKMTPEDKKEILEQRDVSEFAFMHRLRVKEQFIDHIEDRHSSELAFELCPDEFAFLVMQCIISNIGG